MKTVKVIFTIFCCSLMLAGCNDDDAAPQGSISVEESAMLGTWSVARYSDGPENETSSFSNITFGFEEANLFLILKDNEALLTGTWTLRDQGRMLDITVPDLAGENEAFGEDLYEISDNWGIPFLSEMELHLIDGQERFELERVP